VTSPVTTPSSPAAAFAAEDSDRPLWYYDASSNRYMVEDGAGNWIHIPKEDFQLLLKSRGLRNFADKESDERISPADAERLTTILDRRVDYCGRLAGRPRGYYVFEDTPCLVTRSPKLITPAPPSKPDPEHNGFPLLHAMFAAMFADEAQDQRPYLYGWWQHTMQALYDGRPTRGMALVLCGPPAGGKTCLKDIIKRTCGDREVYPYAFMLGRDNFNKELTESVIWCVDDEVADTTRAGRARFGAEIKKIVANTAMRCRGMHRDGFTVEPLRRLIICTNDEPDKLEVLPEINDDIADKLLILRCSHAGDTVPRGTESQKRALFDSLCAELPAFLHWLINDFALPDNLLGRFGVTHYCHPDVYEAIHQISPERMFLDMLDRALLFNNVGEWTGSTEALRDELLHEDSPLGAQDKKHVPAPAWIGRRLKKLQHHYPRRFRSHRTAACTVWTILTPEAADPAFNFTAPNDFQP
jgi:hypothetical protein